MACRQVSDGRFAHTVANNVGSVHKRRMNETRLIVIEDSGISIEVSGLAGAQ